MVQTTPLGVPMAVRLLAARVCGAEPSPQLTTTEPPPGGVVGDGRGLVGVDEGPEQDGARRAPLDSRDLVAGRAGQRGVEDGRDGCGPAAAPPAAGDLAW